VSALKIKRFWINTRDYDFRFFLSSLRHYLAGWLRYKTTPPKVQAITAGWIFVANPVRHGNVTSVRNGVSALDRLPRRMLTLTELGFL
jgi:hypothetical protein